MLTMNGRGRATSIWSVIALCISCPKASLIWEHDSLTYSVLLAVPLWILNLMCQSCLTLLPLLVKVSISGWVNIGCSLILGKGGGKTANQRLKS